MFCFTLGTPDPDSMTILLSFMEDQLWELISTLTHSTTYTSPVSLTIRNKIHDCAWVKGKGEKDKESWKEKRWRERGLDRLSSTSIFQ